MSTASQNKKKALINWMGLLGVVSLASYTAAVCYNVIGVRTRQPVVVYTSSSLGYTNEGNWTDAAVED